MDGILTLHEVLHHTYAKKKVGVVLKLDFEKAYDKINWDFLLDCHKMRGFNDTWCDWIKKILHNGTVSIKLNNEMGPYFQSFKGVRQGDPLSPFLFNLAVESLSKMIFNAQKEKLITGLAPDLIEDGVDVLQYADDTVLCFEHDTQVAVNLKLLLYMFELMSGLKINYLKSGILCVGGDDNILDFYADLFNCQIGHFPMRYLGVPVSFSTLRCLEWIFVDEKFMKRCESWIGQAASLGGRLTLLNSSLSSIVYYYMAMFLLPKTFIEKLDKRRRRFF